MDYLYGDGVNCGSGSNLIGKCNTVFVLISTQCA